MNWWRRGNTRTFGMRLNESSEIRLQVDGEDVSFNANLLYRNVYTLRQRMYLSSKAQFLAVLGYDNETCTFRWIWENIDHFDASKFNFVVTDWDNVLGTKGYRVLDNVFYNDKHADDEEWPVSYTHLDVYKRQAAYQSPTGAHRRSTGRSLRFWRIQQSPCAVRHSRL